MVAAVATVTACTTAHAVNVAARIAAFARVILAAGAAVVTRTTIHDDRALLSSSSSIVFPTRRHGSSTPRAKCCSRLFDRRCRRTTVA